MSVGKTPAPARGQKLLLSVGLVSVPVKLGAFTKERPLRATGICPVHEVKLASGPRICTHDGHEVDEPVMAFEYEGRWVTGVDRSDHKSAKAERLELKSQVDLAELDPAVYEKTFIVWPQEGGEAAHDLLAKALRENGKALIGTTTISTSTRALAIRWSELTGCLLAHVLAYDEAVQWNDAKLVSQAIEQRPQADAQQMALAEQLLATLTSDFELGDVEDTYQTSLLAAVKAAAMGQPAPAPVDAPAAAPVGDLMVQLQASVAAAGKPAPKKRAKKEAA